MVARGVAVFKRLFLGDAKKQSLRFECFSLSLEREIVKRFIVALTEMANRLTAIMPEVTKFDDADVEKLTNILSRIVKARSEEQKYINVQSEGISIMLYRELERRGFHLVTLSYIRLDDTFRIWI